MVTIKYVWNKLNPSEKVDYGTTVKATMDANPIYAGAGALLASLATSDTALNAAITDPNGNAATVKEKVKTWKTKIKAVAGFVQNLANEQEDVLALEIITNAGFTARAKGSKTLPDLAIEQGEEAQSVKLRRKRLTGEKKKSTAIIWQMCTDNSNPDNWKQIRVTNTGTIIVPNLISGMRYYFRTAVVMDDVEHDFSEFVSILVD